MRRAALATALLLLALAAGVLATSPAGASEHGSPSTRTRTPIKHFVTLMQENHSFDNYFGTYPGADGIPAGTCMPAGPGKPCVKPWRIGSSPIEDLGHSAPVFKAQYAGGRMNGFVRAFADARMNNHDLPMGHYDGRDIPFYWNVADDYVLFDRHFTSASAGSVTNHMYWVSGSAGGHSDSIPDEGFTVPTIFDRLQKAGISWKFYIENYDPAITWRARGTSDRGSQVIWCPLLAYPRFVDNPELNKHIVSVDQYFTDLENNKLPAVSFIVPAGSSEHPPGSIAAGEAFVSNLLGGLMRSDEWKSSSFMWTYDDWGGWYDHVKPPRVDAHGLGFRAPALLVSPYAKQGYIDSTPTDFTSQLKFIESNWGLKPLATRDAKANGLDSAFDFGAPPRKALFVSRERSGPVTEVRGQGVVYGAYAIGVLIPAFVIAGAFRLRNQPRHRVRGRR